LDKDSNKVEGKKQSYSYDWLIIASGCSIVPEEVEGMMDDWHNDIHDFYTLAGAIALREKMKYFDKGRVVLNIAELPYKCPVAPIEFVFMADWYFDVNGARENVEIEMVTPMAGAFSKPIASGILGEIAIQKNIKVMSNEEQILERLDRIEARLAPISQSANSLKELREDLIPLSSQAFRLVIRELEDVESSFQLEDLMALTKRMLRSVKHITFTLEQLENIVDFVQTIEPLLKSAVPQMINYLDDLEQRGVLRIINSMLDVRAKIAMAYNADDIDQIGDGAVAALGLAKKLSDPKAVEFLVQFAGLPSKIDLASAKPIGPFGMLGALASKETRQGFGVLMELTRAMGTLKNGDKSRPAEQTEPIA
jgi:uncharacterized protein YjgD (DUF1641 family)